MVFVLRTPPDPDKCEEDDECDDFRFCDNGKCADCDCDETLADGCSESSQNCTCGDSAACTSKQQCVGGSCQRIACDPSCSTGKYCKDGSCVPYTKACVGGNKHADGCDSATGKCTCGSKSECGGRNPYCVDGECMVADYSYCCTSTENCYSEKYKCGDYQWCCPAGADLVIINQDDTTQPCPSNYNGSGIMGCKNADGTVCYASWFSDNKCQQAP